MFHTSFDHVILYNTILKDQWLQVKKKQYLPRLQGHPYEIVKEFIYSVAYLMVI